MVLGTAQHNCWLIVSLNCCMCSGAVENGGVLGRGKGPRNRRASDIIKNSSLVEAQMQFLEQRNLNQRPLTRSVCLNILLKQSQYS